jgi:hypothetical protein
MAEATLQSLETVAAPPTQLPNIRVDMFSSHGFALAQRICKAYMTSNSVPAAFRAINIKREKRGNDYVDVEIVNEAALGNSLVAMETAMAVGVTLSAVMQNANMIEGHLTWSGKYVIAAINASGRFSPLRFRIENRGPINTAWKEKGTWDRENKRYNMIEHPITIENIVCTAWAYVMDGKKRTDEVIEGAPVSMRMAVEEGWYAKPGSKWQGDMKDLMMQYRAGSFFGNVHAPDVIMGMGKTTEEIEDTLEFVKRSDGAYEVDVDALRKGADPTPAAARAQPHQAEDVVDTTSAQAAATPAATAATSEPSTANDPLGSQPDVAHSGEIGSLLDGDTLEMALSNVENGDYDAARDLKRGLPTAAQQEIEVAITKAQSAAAPSPSYKVTPQVANPAQAAQAVQARPARRSMNI